MKLIGTLLTAAIIALTTAVISNTSGVKLNAREIDHKAAIQAVINKSITDNLDKQIKHLENIENYLRNITRKELQ